MDDAVATIRSLLVQTSQTLRSSFVNYWPTDDKNDPSERNLSLHFAHAMLSAGFSTFAEAHHSDRAPIRRIDSDRAPIRRIDIFGLAPGNAWFLGGEFKRLHSIEKLESLTEDMQRLNSFRPRSEYSPLFYGPTFAAAVSCCKGGYGIVGGLHSLAGDKRSSSILDVWLNPDQHATESTYGEVVRRMKEANAVLPPPLPIIEFPNGSRYFLLAAVFAVPCFPVADAAPRKIITTSERQERTS